MDEKDHRKSEGSFPEDEPIMLPQTIAPDWVKSLASALDRLSRKEDVTSIRKIITCQVAADIFKRTTRLLQKEPTLLSVVPSDLDASVVVVGDTHGQFHDVLQMFKVAGDPSQSKIFILNGDFVDRGAWGFEILLLFCCWKLALPDHVFLLRGNHESSFCTLLYGYQGELKAKYGEPGWNKIFKACEKLFSHLPLAAVVNQATLILHGGLFRPLPAKGRRSKKMRLENERKLGNLDDLRQSSKGGPDPDGEGTSRLASDVLWSDPGMDSGFVENEKREIGMIFGPDITEQFLSENGLKLIIRSHEGPDAREDRPDMGHMLEGWTEDHVTPSGKLITVFSAPDYPQFVAEDCKRFYNKGAVAVLSGPDYATFTIKQYDADLSRPTCLPYYELASNDGDEEEEDKPPCENGGNQIEEDEDQK